MTFGQASEACGQSAALLHLLVTNLGQSVFQHHHQHSLDIILHGLLLLLLLLVWFLLLDDLHLGLVQLGLGGCPVQLLGLGELDGEAGVQAQPPRQRPRPAQLLPQPLEAGRQRGAAREAEPGPTLLILADGDLSGHVAAHAAAALARVGGQVVVVWRPADEEAARQVARSEVRP